MHTAALNVHVDSCPLEVKSLPMQTILVQLPDCTVHRDDRSSLHHGTAVTETENGGGTGTVNKAESKYRVLGVAFTKV